MVEKTLQCYLSAEAEYRRPSDRLPTSPRVAGLRHRASPSPYGHQEHIRGRMEKRIPIAIVVRLTPVAQDQPAANQN